jgi:hypothetical protein
MKLLGERNWYRPRVLGRGTSAAPEAPGREPAPAAQA